MIKKFVTLFVLLLTPFIFLHASEIDQLTDREKYQDFASDFTEKLNSYTNDLIASAVENYNKKYAGTDMPAELIHNYIAFEIYKVTAGSESDEFGMFLPSSVNLFYALSKKDYGPLQSWIETEENSSWWTRIKEDNIYDGVFPSKYNRNFVIKVGGEFIGPDKIDHFFDQGYSYWIKSGQGERDDLAIEYGVDSEFGWFGLKAGGVFSFADLRANWAGYQFYKNLFTGWDSYLKITPNGTVRINKTFDWKNHIDWQYDEIKNPFMLTRLNMSRICRHIEENFDQYSTTYYFLKSRGILDCIKERETFYLSEDMEFDSDLYFDLDDLIAHVKS